MDFNLIGLLLAVLFLMGLNGCLSIAEIGLLSANRTALQRLAEGGNRSARLAIDLVQNPSQFVPAVQAAVSFVNALTAALAGIAAVEWTAPRLAGVNSVAVQCLLVTLAVAIAVGVCATVSVVVGDLLPQRLAISQSTNLACRAARVLHVLRPWLAPCVWLSSTAADGLANFCGARRAAPQLTSLQQIRHLIELGTAEGVVGEVQRRLAFEALQLGDRTARQIMKPRIDIDAIDVETPPEELLGTIAMAGFSRLPVYDGDLDHIIGFVHLKDVLRQQYLGWKLDLRKLIRPALTVPDIMRLDQLLVRFQEQRNQLAIVVDEFGATRGMVTLEDVLEELVGEMLTDQSQRGNQKITQRDATSWLVDGAVSIADLLERLGLQRHLDEAPRHVSSVGGLVLDLIGRLPKVGEKTSWQELQLEVLELDGRRIDRVLVTLGTKSAAR